MIPNQRGDHNHNNKKWSNLMPLFVALVVIAEIAFLGRLDIANKVSMVNSWADSFYQFTTLPWPDEVVGSGELGVLDHGPEHESCEEWLEREDSVVYSRDFMKEPIFITGSSEELKSCAVGCIFRYDSEKKPDAGFGHANGAPGVLRSMESAQYYAENNIDYARRWYGAVSSSVGRYHYLLANTWTSSDVKRSGYSIVMTTSLSSDVPVGYFSWAEYDIMAPMQPKSEKALAAAFISNCAARNFRLQALEGLEKENIKIDSYGGCHRNHDGRVDKVETLKRYKFSLAFENSDEEDYVTEKFFQSLVAGTIPVVVGAPNIQEFAPWPDAVLHIKELKDIPSVAKTMKYLAEHPDAYNQSLRWKFEGPSDSFKALVDMAAVHSSCRLCIHLATMIRQTEEQSLSFSKRPCKCSRGLETVYHVYVRERGRFEMVSIFLRSRNLSLKALESAVLLKFKSLKHVPIWKDERPESIRGTNELKVYRIYPLGLTQRQALYTFSFKGDDELRSHLKNNPCAKFEVIFV